MSPTRAWLAPTLHTHRTGAVTRVFGAQTTLWRLYKRGATAEAALHMEREGLLLEIRINEELLIGGRFKPGNSAEQAGAIACSVRVELERHGWVETPLVERESRPSA